MAGVALGDALFSFSASMRPRFISMNVNGASYLQVNILQDRGNIDVFFTLFV